MSHAPNTAQDHASTPRPGFRPVSVGRFVLLALSLLTLAGWLWQAIDPAPLRFAGISIDRLSMTLGLLVSSIGFVVYRFSRRYLHGDPKRDRFLARLLCTVVSAYVLMLSTNLLLLFAVWLLTSVNLHALLTHYSGRIEAQRAARKKFLISRIGDAALVAALGLAWSKWGTVDLLVLHDRVAEGVAPGAVTPMVLLVVLAALTKSAQFPFHSWLPETMESPTPVSALMHAGVINAGGALLLRFVPLLMESPSALLLLTVVGTLTMTMGMLAMWTQVNIKRTLAWSTVTQMGFMMLQFGLGVFAAATLHIVAHGCYKAWNFLRTGDVPARSPAGRERSAAETLGLAAMGTALAIPMLVFASWLTGFSTGSPGKLALLAILALSAGQVWVSVFGRGMSAPLQVVCSLSLTLVGAVVALALYAGSEAFLGPVLGTPAGLQGWGGWLIALIPVLAIVGLVVLHAFLPSLGRTSAGRAWYVHALHGFYFGAWADRVVGKVWPGRPVP